ncbi:MAG: TadE/TadG family type IV pilus assembly protein [Bacteriovoracaceae bacterium]
MKRFGKECKNQKGQSTIEFIIGFTIIFGLVMLMLRTTLIYGEGYALHYATFSASRAYLTHEFNHNDLSSAHGDAERFGRKVFNLFKIRNLINGFDGKINFNSQNEMSRRVYVGAWAEFQKTFSPMAMFGGDEELRMRSESFIGKEPGRGYCHGQILNLYNNLASGLSGGASEVENHRTLFDNGC